MAVWLDRGSSCGNSAGCLSLAPASYTLTLSSLRNSAIQMPPHPSFAAQPSR